MLVDTTLRVVAVVPARPVGYADVSRTPAISDSGISLLGGAGTTHIAQLAARRTRDQGGGGAQRHGEHPL